MDKSKQLEQDLPPYVGAKSNISDQSPGKIYSYRNGAAKLSGAIVKELSRKPELFRKLDDFQPKGGLQQRQIVCGPTGITVEFSSPLQGISNPWYIQTNKRPDLINDKITKNSSREEDDEDDTIFGNFTKGKSTVVAVDCKWKNGIKLTNSVSRSRSRQINPNLKTVDFDFESKMKFAKEVDQICQDYLPEDNVLILEGNNSHGSSLKYSLHTPKETVVQPELPYNPELPALKQDKIRAGTTTIDPADVESIDYNDIEEHKILLIPSYTKAGFDVDTSQRYRFPYTAKFLIGAKKYERSFELQLPFSESPQHFGLVFTFPEKQQSKVSSAKSADRPTNTVIKSMISVYSIFPHSSRHCSLKVYEFPDMQKPGTQGSRKGNLNLYTPKKGPHTQARRIAKDYLANMDDNLKEEKLVQIGWKGQNFGVKQQLKGKELCNEHFLYPKNKDWREDPQHEKIKNKQKIMTNIKLDSRET